MYWGTKFIYDRYKKPIIISENGKSCHDEIAADGHIHDTERIDYINGYLKRLKKSISEGTEVAAYFYWSLMDNFEWAYGYTERFGLIHVDYETQKRTLKDSALRYSEIIRNNGSDI